GRLLRFLADRCPRVPEGGGDDREGPRLLRRHGLPPPLRLPPLARDRPSRRARKGPSGPTCRVVEPCPRPLLSSTSTSTRSTPFSTARAAFRLSRPGRRSCRC